MSSWLSLELRRRSLKSPTYLNGDFALHLTPARVFTAWRSGVVVFMQKSGLHGFLSSLMQQKYNVKFQHHLRTLGSKPKMFPCTILNVSRNRFESGSSVYCKGVPVRFLDGSCFDFQKVCKFE